VRVCPEENAMVVEPSVTVRAGEEDEVFRLTVPCSPMVVMVIVEVPCEPWEKEIVLGAEVSVRFPVTVNINETVLVIPPPVPVTVIV
jgi:hypothetical protein